MLLTCNHLTKSYDGQRVLDDLSFRIDSQADNRDLLLLGPSGSPLPELLHLYNESAAVRDTSPGAALTAESPPG